MAAKKPKAPPFITAKGVFEKLKKAVDDYEDISALARKFGGG